MAILDDALVKQFARATNDRVPPKKEDNLYGTVKYDEDGNFAGVIFDGSSIVTPCTKVVDVEDGDRVIVSVRNREAVVTGNVSRPAINTSSIETKDLTVKDKIQVYAPVWDPETQEFTGDFHTIEVVSMSETNPYYNEIWAFQKADVVLMATPFTDEYDVVHYPEVQMYNLGVNTLRVADREGTQHGLGIYYGSIDGFSVPAKGYIDVDIDFPEGAFSKTHRVALTPQSAQTHADTGEISWAITSRTLDSVTVRVFNNASNARFMAFDWIAIGE